MYPQDKAGPYSSPYGGGAYGVGEEGGVDKVKYFFEDHGKAIIALLILVVIGFFAFDFFVGSYRQVDLQVVNTEKSPLGADLIVYKSGETNAVYQGAPTTLSLKKGTYSADIMASGYRSLEQQPFEVTGDADQVQSFELEKPLVTKITQVTFPQQVYLGQETTGSVSLSNSGAKDESIELVFEGDFDDLMDNGFVLEANPAAVTVPAQNSVIVSLGITAPKTLELKDKKKGDSKKGIVRVKFRKASEAKKEIAFKLLPAADITVKPASLTKKVTAGSVSFKLGTVTIENDAKVEAQNITISVQLDPSIESEAATWFSFDTTQIDSIAAGDEQAIQVYISPPISPETTIIAGQSHIVVEGIAWKQTIPLNITIEGVEALLTAQLSPSSINIRRQNNGEFEISTNGKVTIKNNGEVAIQNIEVLNYNPACRQVWILFDQENEYASLPAKQPWVFSFRITAPPSATIDQPQTCSLRVQYTDPLTSEIETIKTVPEVLRITPTD